MEFKNEDLLCTVDIENLITSEFPNKKASIIAKRLSKYCFITNDVLYSLQNNISYQKETTNIDKKIVYYTSLLIEESFKKFELKDANYIKKVYSKAYKSIFKNTSIQTYYPQLLMNLQKTNIVFNHTLNEFIQ